MMEKIIIPQDSFFIFHVHVEHAWAEWCDKYCFLYLIYLILEDVRLEKALYFTSVISINTEAKADNHKAAVSSTVVAPDTRSSGSKDPYHVHETVISNDD